MELELFLQFLFIDKAKGSTIFRDIHVVTDSKIQPFSKFLLTLGNSSAIAGGKLKRMGRFKIPLLANI